MNGESLAAAGLLETLSRAAVVLAESRHPFVCSTPFSFFVPPAGVRVGTVFTLPDGREVSFAVSVAVAGDAFHVDGSVTVESDVLLELPRASAPAIQDALAVLEDHAGEVAAASGRLIDQLLEDIV
ncbi:hypothetical protein [Nonomuraea sp. NPDC001023]|uniref:hypothetical protein n=1 Tax=unclassified Nonomuraea TaxID=2593643 RepID=UPI003330868E